MASKKGWRYWRNLGCFVIVVLALAAVGLAVGVSWMQADAFLHPHRRYAAETPADRGLAYRDVAFPAADGLTLRGWYFPSGNGAAILVGHGYGAYRRLDQAEVLARHGYGVLTFDWRAHGESDGNLCSLGYYEVRDVEGALAWLAQQPDVDPGHIGMLGESMGAVIAIRAAARMPDIQAVVAASPYPTLDEAVRNVWRGTGWPIFPFVPLQVLFGRWQTGLDLDDMRPLDDVAAISPRPILILAGGLDPITGPHAGPRYYAAAGQPKELWFEPELGHLSFLQVYPAEYERRVVGFFDAALLGD
jgi:alpha-beta hydrolase superfamily lysophospholipase